MPSQHRQSIHLGYLQSRFEPNEKAHRQKDACILWDATVSLETPSRREQIVSVSGALSHGGLRKGNPDLAVITGFYCSSGVAEN